MTQVHRPITGRPHVHASSSVRAVDVGVAGARRGDGAIDAAAAGQHEGLLPRAERGDGAGRHHRWHSQRGLHVLAHCQLLLPDPGAACSDPWAQSSTCMHACMLACLHACVYAYVHAYNTYIHTIHAYIQYTRMHPNTHTQTHTHSHTHTHRRCCSFGSPG